VTKAEIKNLVAIAAANYPMMQKNEFGPTARLWHVGLKDIPYEVAEKALINVLMEAVYFPTVGEIRKEALGMMRPRVLGETEAWSMVVKALSRHPFSSEKAFASLSDPVEKAARVIGWQRLCYDTDQARLIRDFRSAYRETLEYMRHEEATSGEAVMISGAGEIGELGGA